MLLTSEGSCEEGRNALDNLRDPAGSMVAGNRQLIHVGWVHSFVAGAGARRITDSNHRRA